MSKIERYAGNLRAFGSNAQGLERTLFGETTQGDDLTSQVTNSFLRGWGIVGPSENPSMEDFNAAMYTISQFIAYQHQMGIPEWDALQEYYSGSICVRNGEAYLSLVDSNIGSAPPSAKWTSVLTAKNALANISGFLKSSNNLSEIAAAGSVAQAAAQANIGLTASKFSGRLMGVPRVITSSGTYTATAGTTFVIVEQIGGGGASGNIPATNASQYSITTPASMGAYAKAYFGSGFNGVSCIIGAGAAGSSSAGGKGGDTSFGSLLVCPGGPGSQSGAIGALPVVTGGPSGPTTPTISGGTLMESSYGQLTPPAACVASGVFLNYVNTDRSLLGNAGVGGSGYYNSVSSSAKVGINGNDGIIIVWEFS
ncbi:TPA: hypothetical protein ACPZG1_001255 [Yersinia enterocolitica]